METLIIFGVCALPLFILGIFFRWEKGLILLSGYNTLPKELRDTIDKRWMGRAAGNMMIRMSIELALMGVAIYIESGILFAVFFAALMLDACFSSIRIYRKFPKTKMSEWGVRILVATSVIMIVGTGALFYAGEREPNITIGYDSIGIDGMYGTEIAFRSIREITLIESSMRDIGAGRRLNGYGGPGGMLKGNFTAGLLFVDSTSSPTIRITRFPQNIYISFRDSERTRALYAQMTGAINFD